jgi:hypothetical protein
MRKILFITTSSLATNPRLVKEFEFLKAHYECTVISFEHTDWSLEPSNAIIKRNLEIEFITINRHKSLIQTLLSKVWHKMAIVLNPFFKSSTKIAAYASNDKTQQLGLALKKIKNKNRIQRVIAHNLGAFYPALKLAKQLPCKLQLDVEDYHPGEELYFNKKYEYQNRLLLMQQAFNTANVITYASEGIKLKCEDLFQLHPETKREVIINAFRSEDFLIPNKTNTHLNCVWFSQNISPKRGLEEVFAVAKDFPNINFHLIGKPNASFIERMQPSENVIIHKPMEQKTLHEFLSTMDIGLALENKNEDGNRDICLTNKFLAYLQAGLYIFASNTFGQSHFMDHMGSQFGVIIKTSLKDEIHKLDNSVLNIEKKRDRWEQAKSVSWERQSEILINVME